MATVNFSVPEDVKQAFNREFEGQNKSAVLTALMREAVERAQAARRSKAQQGGHPAHPRAPHRCARACAGSAGPRTQGRTCLKLVVDASVALKWFFRDRDDEPDSDLALKLLDAVAAGSVRLVQPPHFVAEMAAVLARESPQSAADDLRDLLDLDFETRADAAIYARAMRLASELDHHLFATLYHAVAVETPSARLVTADARYLRKAGDARICALADIEPSLR